MSFGPPVGKHFSAYLKGDCLSHRSVAVIKHHDQSDLEKEGFLWACGSRGISVHDGRARDKAAGAQRKELTS